MAILGFSVCGFSASYVLEDATLYCGYTDKSQNLRITRTIEWLGL